MIAVRLALGQLKTGLQPWGKPVDTGRRASV